MEDIILNIINSFGYIGIFLLIAIENIFPPIPSEVILTFGGFATTFTSMNVVGVIIAATFGAYVGAIALYMFGYLINVDRLSKFLDSKLARILHFKSDDLKKAESWFNKYNHKAVFIGRFIPIVRSLVSIPAGMAKMPFVKFSLLTIIGSSIWNIVLVSLGVVAGKNWEVVASYVDIFSKVALILLIVIFVYLVYLFIKNRFKK